jgi:nitrogen-specific signal transduction histidine kinase
VETDVADRVAAAMACDDAGGVDYITKPFQLQEVLARVKIHLTLRQLQKQLEQSNEGLAEKVIELREAQERVIALEKAATELRMAGGFAHEMRNALSGAKGLLGQVLHGRKVDNTSTLCLENSHRLKELYLQLKKHVPPAARASILALFKSTFYTKGDSAVRAHPPS